MLSKYKSAARFLVVFALTISSFTTVAEAQMSSQGQGPGSGGSMVGGGWGMYNEMGAFRWVGVLVLALVALGTAFLAIRQRDP